MPTLYGHRAPMGHRDRRKAAKKSSPILFQNLKCAVVFTLRHPGCSSESSRSNRPLGTETSSAEKAQIMGFLSWAASQLAGLAPWPALCLRLVSGEPGLRGRYTAGTERWQGPLWNNSISLQHLALKLSYTWSVPSNTSFLYPHNSHTCYILFFSFFLFLHATFSRFLFCTFFKVGHGVSFPTGPTLAGRKVFSLDVPCHGFWLTSDEEKPQHIHKGRSCTVL